MSKLMMKEYRKKQRLSLSQLSYKSGVARGYLSEIESGKYDNPSLSVICALCRALKITPNDLINSELYS